ncbi:MAG: sigma 54-interacting transcriptional regulator [Planctomycetes bacterium]|nr:sigma 54-interacting transcriptional regulator [Planctomycetota bacterium]
MKDKQLSEYLEKISSFGGKSNWQKVRHLGETAVKKLATLHYTPQEEFTLYRQMGLAYYNLVEYPRSVDIFYKAYLVASRNSFPPIQVAYAHYSLGLGFLVMHHIKQSLAQLLKVEQYYQKYGDATPPMNRNKYYFSLIYIALCHLYNNEIDKAREVIEQKLAGPMETESNGIILNSYHHLKGEYAYAIKDYVASRKAFNECVKISEEFKFPRGILEAKVHIVTLDILEGHLDSAVRLATSIFQDARRIKYNELVCEAGLLLSKCYSLFRQPNKAQAIEKRIKPLLRKLDIIWFYEKTREFELLYQQMETSVNLPQAMHPDTASRETWLTRTKPLPEVLAQAINHCSAQMPYKSVIIGNAPPMREVCQLINRIGPTDLPVLIQGETGTGKELVAHAVHHLHNLRSSKPLLAFNCGAFPETLIESELFGHTKGAFTGASEKKKGYIELASGGSLFMDEVANMSSSMQQKLLRVLEEKQVWPLGAEKAIPINTRFIFASNRNLDNLVRQKLFREDLFYRINTIVITLPSLRDRKDDIPLLIQHFLAKYSPKDARHSAQPPVGITQDAQRLLTTYSWPGNVRELENEAKKICVLYPDAKLIKDDMLSDAIRACKPTSEYLSNNRLTLKEQRADWERNTIKETIKKCSGNITKTASRLGLDRSGLYKKMRELNIPFKDVD